MPIILKAPPSKSVSHRALLVASMSSAGSVVRNTLLCDDVLATIESLGMLGAAFEKHGHDFVVRNVLKPKNEYVKINCNESGSTFRFLVALATFAGANVEINGCGKLRERPIEPLVKTLRTLGAHIECDNREKPLIISGCTLGGSLLAIDGSISSQFLSGVLMAAPFYTNDMTIRLEGNISSRPYIDMTINVMRTFGVHVSWQDQFIQVKSGQQYKRVEYDVEGDYSSAAFLLAASLLTRKKITIENLDPFSAQGDKNIVGYFKEMGAKICWQGNALICEPAPMLKSINANLENTPDLFPVLSIVAAFAKGKSVLGGIDALQYKESNRIMAMYENLRSCCIDATLVGNAMHISGADMKPANIKTFNDHRISMAFQIAKLIVRDMHIDNVKCVSKSYPGFCNDLMAFIDGGE